MEGHGADGAQLLDELCDDLLWLALSHQQVAVTHTHEKQTEGEVNAVPGKLHPGRSSQLNEGGKK